MGLLDGLIKQNAAQPKKDMEYVVTYDVPKLSYWNGTEAEDRPPIPKGTIVIDVEQLKGADGWNRGYDFTVKSTGLRHHTNYPDALAENTEENWQRIREYWAAHEERDEAQRKVNRLAKRIKTLEQ